MAEKPISFNSEMVRAILDDRKTQTRRVCKDQTATKYEWLENCEIYPLTLGEGYTGWGKDCGFSFLVPTKCPYGKVGDLLWVKETNFLYGHWIKNGKTKTGKQAYKFMPEKSTKNMHFGARYLDNPPVEICTKKNELGWFKRPSIFMAKIHTRTWVEKTGIRVERVQDITNGDIQAEGAAEFGCVTHRLNFETLWNSINEKRGHGWDVNPWCWCISFKKVKNNCN